MSFCKNGQMNVASVSSASMTSMSSSPFFLATPILNISLIFLEYVPTAFALNVEHSLSMVLLILFLTASTSTAAVDTADADAIVP